MKRLIVFMVLVQFLFASYTMAEDERFIPSDLVVKDRKAHRVWMRDANVIGNAMTWDDAFKAVKNLNEQKYAGLQCWRLPEKEELLALSAYISAKAKVSIKGKGGLEPFTHVQPSLYWSATHSTYNDVWVTDLVFDSVSVVSKKSLYYVWPVCDYDKKELEAEERQIAEERKKEEQAEAIRQEKARQEVLAKEKEAKETNRIFDYAEDATERAIELYRIYQLDVFAHYGLYKEYNTELKRAVFKKTQDYIDKLNELKKNKKEILQHYYYIKLSEKYRFSDYDIKRKGFELELDNNIILSPPKSVKGVVFSSLPIKSKSDRYFYITYLFLPLSERKGLSIENNKENINIYLIFKISNAVYYNEFYGGEVLVADSVRLVIVDKGGDEVYFDRVYSQGKK